MDMEFLNALSKFTTGMFRMLGCWSSFLPSSPETKTCADPSLYILPFREMETWMGQSWGCTYLGLDAAVVECGLASWGNIRWNVNEESLECVPSSCSGQWMESRKVAFLN